MCVRIRVVMSLVSSPAWVIWEAICFNTQHEDDRRPPTADRQLTTADSQRPTAKRQLPTADHRPPNTNHRQPTTNCWPPTANRQLPTAHCRLPTAVCQPSFFFSKICIHIYFFLYPWYYLHMSRDSVSPKCWIFSLIFNNWQWFIIQ